MFKPIFISQSEVACSHDEMMKVFFSAVFIIRLLLVYTIISCCSLQEALQFIVASCVYCCQNKLGDTPLHSAAWRGHSVIVQMLLEKGESLFKVDNTLSVIMLIVTFMIYLTSI